MNTIPLRVRFWLLVLTAATATVAGVGITSAQAVSRQDWWVALALLTLIICVERLAISFPVFAGSFQVSVGAPLALAAAMHLGVGLGALVVLTGHVLDSVAARRDPLKSMTNICAFVTATAAGGTVYWSFADHSTSPVGSPQNLLLLVLASVAFVAISTSAVALIVAPVIGIPMRELWKSTLRLSAIEAVTLPAVGGLVAIAAAENAAAVLLLIFPLLGPQMAYRALVRAQQSVRNTVEGLADAIEQRDVYTANHSIRVTESVRAILEEMSDVPYELTDTILAASRVHDVGKVGTRDATLHKPGPLTNEERREMRRHAEIGGDIVSRIDEYRLTAAIIRHHHEHWDGNGYPDKIAGRDIPLGSRIIAVADAFDAMTSDRPYRRAMSPRIALEEIRRHSGTQFDPRVVEAFERAWSQRTTPHVHATNPQGHEIAPHS
jgi:HD-GYP domain-containing protein (c-di-GMP phosphodiesterase class II)